MSRVHRRGVIAGPKGGGGKTYAQFEAQIATLATSGEIGWDQVFTGGTTPAKAYRTTAAAQTGSMAGSTWGPSASAGYARTSATQTCRAIQHALSSEAVFLDQIANGWEIFYRTTASSTQPAPAVTRNGFTSTTSATSSACAQITELIRWDGTQAWISNPSTGSAETLYTW